MYNKLMKEKELNVKVGDKVSVMGNRGIVTEVFRTSDSTSVRVHFTDELAEWGQYQDGVYGGYEVLETEERRESMNKAKFQKTIKAIRAELNTGEYPKAMMTGQQMANNTATVNCGGEWNTPEGTHQIADAVLNHEAFKKLMEQSGATFKKESLGANGRVQLRINF